MLSSSAMYAQYIPTFKERFFTLFLLFLGAIHALPCSQAVGASHFESIKEAIVKKQGDLSKTGSSTERSQILYSLALDYLQDQEIEKAFFHFLEALKEKEPLTEPAMSHEEHLLFEKALYDYLHSTQSHSTQQAELLIKHYGERADASPGFIHLNFLIALAYANMELYREFFKRFYLGYAYLKDSFLAYKAQATLYLRLSQFTRSAEERDVYQKCALNFLMKAIDRNGEDASLYRVLFFLAKMEKNDSLIRLYLQKMVKHSLFIPRNDICAFVEECVRLEEFAVGQWIIDQAKKNYEYSKALSRAEDFLKQGRG